MRNADETWQTGCVFKIERMSAHDGPGMRTVIFLKGCPLHCRWCHNPEGLNPMPELRWTGSLCTGCGTCVHSCPEHLITMEGNRPVFHRDQCLCCRKCLEACPGGALDIVGMNMTTDDVMLTIMKDIAYYRDSGGGVTLSGGEACAQPRFALEILRRCRDAGIHTALDTSGTVAYETIRAMLPFTDLVLYDVKEIDPQRHTQYTGVDNGIIITNLTLIGQYIKDNEGPALWVRTPLIPNFTFRKENIVAIGNILSTIADYVERWELLAFNGICAEKYDSLGVCWDLYGTEMLSAAQIDDALNWAEESKFSKKKIFRSGFTR